MLSFNLTFAFPLSSSRLSRAGFLAPCGREDRCPPLVVVVVPSLSRFLVDKWLITWLEARNQRLIAFLLELTCRRHYSSSILQSPNGSHHHGSGTLHELSTGFATIEGATDGGRRLRILLPSLPGSHGCRQRPQQVLWCRGCLLMRETDTELKSPTAAKSTVSAELPVLQRLFFSELL